MESAGASQVVTKLHLDLLLNVTWKWQEQVPSTLIIPFTHLLKILFKYDKCIIWRWEFFLMCVLYFIVSCFLSHMCHVSFCLVILPLFNKLKVWYATISCFSTLCFHYYHLHMSICCLESLRLFFMINFVL
jgi:hypothetical protein